MGLLSKATGGAPAAKVNTSTPAPTAAAKPAEAPKPAPAKSPDEIAKECANRCLRMLSLKIEPAEVVKALIEAFPSLAEKIPGMVSDLSGKTPATSAPKATEVPAEKAPEVNPPDAAELEAMRAEKAAKEAEEKAAKAAALNAGKTEDALAEEEKPRRGRPAGSKNKGAAEAAGPAAETSKLVDATECMFAIVHNPAESTATRIAAFNAIVDSLARLCVVPPR